MGRNNRTTFGKIILDDRIEELSFPKRASYSFGYMVFNRPFAESGGLFKDIIKIPCIDRDTTVQPENTRKDRKNTPLLLKNIVGFENENISQWHSEQYKPTSAEFDILKDVKYLYINESYVNQILSQINISSFTPFLSANKFTSLKTTGEKLQMEVMKKSDGAPMGRCATLNTPVLIDGEWYMLEAKGGNFGDSPIKLFGQKYQTGTTAGVQSKKNSNKIIDILTRLNKKGFKKNLLVAAYTLPGLRQYHFEQATMYIRAVKSTPPISNYIEELYNINEQLNIDKNDLAKLIIEEATKDMANIWDCGILHCGPLHHQNYRFNGISDFGGSKLMQDSGFERFNYDLTSLVYSSQEIIERIYCKKKEQSSQEDITRYQLMARKIIIDTFNAHYSLSLPRNIGTLSLAAHIYEIQKERHELFDGRTFNIVYNSIEPEIIKTDEDFRLKPKARPEDLLYQELFVD